MTVDQLTPRRARLTVAMANHPIRSGKKRSHGKVTFAYDGTRATAERGRNLVAEGTVVDASETGPERWRFVMEDGDVWDVSVGCGCGGK